MKRNAEIKVNNSSVIDQIIAYIKQWLAEGVYRDGDKLPSMTALAADLNVSVSSIREALRNLEALNLIEIIHGRGVFVKSAQLQWQAKFTSFSEMVRQWGKIPSARLLIAETITADSRIAAQLQIGVENPVYHLKRVRLADDEPMAIEDSYLPENRFPGLLESYRDPMSLYELLKTLYQIQPVTGLQTLVAVALSPEDSQLLCSDPKEPALLVNTIAYDREKIPIEYGYSLFRADKYRYVVRVTR